MKAEEFFDGWFWSGIIIGLIIGFLF